ncbi:MAG: hypothetical protein WAT79_10375 [Saprospiraceae bacterium]
MLVQAFNRALPWFTYANYQYQELIGGIQNILIQSGDCKCLLIHPVTGDRYEDFIAYNGSCNELIGTQIDGYMIEEALEHFFISATKHESDGFVLSSSAKAMPGVDRPIKMQGSGHFQMRNDSNLETEFDNMFRKSTYGKYFKLYD